jgi:hypothetical protein
VFPFWRGLLSEKTVVAAAVTDTPLLFPVRRSVRGEGGGDPISHRIRPEIPPEKFAASITSSERAGEGVV